MVDDETGEQGYRDEIHMVNDYLRRFGEVVSADLKPLDADGYTDLRHDKIVIGINVVSEHGILMLVVKMGDLPEAPQPAFYRRLLELNFLATGEGAFAIDQSNRTIYLRSMRPLAGLTYPQFEDLLRSVAAAAEGMRDRFGQLAREGAGSEV